MATVGTILNGKSFTVLKEVFLQQQQEMRLLFQLKVRMMIYDVRLMEARQS